MTPRLLEQRMRDLASARTGDHRRRVGEDLVDRGKLVRGPGGDLEDAQLVGAQVVPAGERGPECTARDA